MRAGAVVPAAWGQVRRTMDCAVLRAARCEPAVAGELASRVRLVWDPSVPDEVELTAPGPLRWFLDRDVVVDGLVAPAADGRAVFVGPLPVPAARTGLTAGAGGTELRHEIVLNPGHDVVALQLRTRDLAGFVVAITADAHPAAAGDAR